MIRSLPLPSTSVRCGAAAVPAVGRYFHCNLLQIGIGLLGLLVGFLFYAMFRTNSPALIQSLVGSKLHVAWPVPQVLQPYFQSFPSAIHVCSFSLLTVGIIGLHAFRYAVFSSLFWTGVNVSFEILQGVNHTEFYHFMVSMPWKMDAITQFAAGGVYDMHDILASVAGGAVAIVVSSFTGGKGEDHVA